MFLPAGKVSDCINIPLLSVVAFIVVLFGKIILICAFAIFLPLVLSLTVMFTAVLFTVLFIVVRVNVTARF